jgi:putative ABC transport system substrate-binding protein
MRRRDFIKAVVGSFAASPLAVRAQQRALPTIGLLSSRSPAVDAHLIALIRQGLNETGFVEGQNVAIDYRWAEGQYDRLAVLAADLARQQVAVIVTLGGDTSALAAKAGTATIPIVFATGSDPIRTGLVNNLHRPGGNITGVSTCRDGGEAVGAAARIAPHAMTTAVLVNPGATPRAEFQLDDIQAAARNAGRDINILNASTIRDIDAAFAKLVQMRADAMLVTTDAFFFTHAPQVVVLAARHTIPTVYFRREFAAAGGLMSYAANPDESYRLLGAYAARILKGEKPGDLPIQRSTNFELVINVSTARALGLEIPPTLLARADEVIE